MHAAHRARPAIVTVLLAIVVLVATVVLWVRWQEPRSIYFPERQDGDYALPQGFSPEDVRLQTPDGVRLHGWFYSATGSTEAATRDDGARPGQGLTVLYLHGNAGNLASRVEKILLLENLGTDVFIVDYRGYGLSEGSPDEAGVYRDALTAYRHLTGERGIDPSTIVILGESLGSAIAVELARDQEAGGVVLEAAFTSALDIAQATYPFLPMRWLMGQHFDSIAKIGDVKAPIIFFHSVTDEFFPMHHPQRLMAAAQTATRLVELHGTHDGASIESADVYREAITPFFETIRRNAGR